MTRDNVDPSPLPADIRNNPVLARWVSVGIDGMLEVRAGKVELGQGVGTSQLQIAADELELPPERIRLLVGHTDHCPDQGLTAGSLSTEVGGMALRAICAEVRACFIEAAAQRLGVAAEQVRVEAGWFFADGAPAPRFGYPELSGAVNLDRPARGTARPKAVSDRRSVGISLQRPDLRRKLFGAGFIHDIEWPGMLHGRVVRPPRQGACTLQLDAAARLAAGSGAGVHTVCVEGQFLAVAAEREEQAIAAADALQRAVRWAGFSELPEPSADQKWLREQPHEHQVVDRASAADGECAAAVSELTLDYSRPYLAHASIGPSCALARWEGDRLFVCSHTQGPHELRRELAAFFEIGIERISVEHADGAGCYGHNGADDAAVDAAVLARAAGRPVRLQWSREDELSWSPFGSAMSIRIAAAFNADGRLVRWSHDSWSYSHVHRPGLVPGIACLAGAQRDPPARARAVSDFPLPAGGGARNALPIYDLPVRRIDHNLLTQPGLRTSALRALGAFANVFAIESAMDELALLAGQDPLAFRLAHLTDPRARAVLHAAAIAAGWGEELAPARRPDALRGRGIGMARYKNSGAYCAVVMEIEVAERIALERVWVAVDAGEVVNPDGLVNQIEGGVLQAASWTLNEAVVWQRDGTVTSRTWLDYPILRFDETPRSITVQLMSQPALPPLGVGECAAGPTAAAIANALAAALGLRMRDLPLTPERLMQAAQSMQAG